MRKPQPTVTIDHSDIAKGMGCEMLVRDQVPNPPSRTKSGVIDVGNERWRFDKNSELSVYIEYAPEENPSTKWVRFWAAA